MICFLDMDGVLVDFHRGVHQAFGVPFNYSISPQRYDFWEDWPKEVYVSRQEVDAISTIDFFAGLQWMYDGKEILQLVEEKFGPENIYLLSCPMPNPQSATGKMMWIEQHLPQYKKRTVITQAPKYLFATKNRVLIDDKDENCNEFSLNFGYAIVVPRPWNSAHNELTIPYLKEELKIFGEN